MNWVIVSAPDESSAPDSVWDGDEFVPIAQINDAFAYREVAGITVESMRAFEGEFQQRFTDRDIRMAEATVTIALAA